LYFIFYIIGLSIGTKGIKSAKNVVLIFLVLAKIVVLSLNKIGVKKMLEHAIRNVVYNWNNITSILCYVVPIYIHLYAV